MELNNSTPLCAIWKQLLADFSAGRSPSSTLSEKASSLIDHVDDCEICLQAALGVDQRQMPALFEFLSRLEGDVSEDDHGYLEKLIADLTNEERAISIAVTGILLPSLPWNLRDEFNERKGNLSPLAVFSGIEAIGLMANRVARDHAMESVRLTDRGEICSERETLVTRDSLSAEVQEFAEISDIQADWLSSWICQVAHFNPRLFLGLRVVECTENDVLLNREERKNVMELGDWWKAGARVDARPELVSYA